jgi:hypothetical protein
VQERRWARFTLETCEGEEQLTFCFSGSHLSAAVTTSSSAAPPPVGGPENASLIETEIKREEKICSMAGQEEEELLHSYP